MEFDDKDPLIHVVESGSSMNSDMPSSQADPPSSTAPATGSRNRNLRSDSETDLAGSTSSISQVKTHRSPSVWSRRSAKLGRTLTLTGAVTFLIGTTIGSGIFASPGLVLLHTHSAGLSLMAWVLGGFIVLCGGCTYAELGVSIPESGGEYPYILRCYGHLMGFLFSWTSNLVLKPGGLAISSIVCAQYLIKPFYLSHDPPTQWISIGIALVILAIAITLNSVDVRLAEKILKYLAYLKLIAIAMTAVIGFVFLAKNSPSSPAYQNLHDAFAGESKSIADFGVAVIVCLWTYDGWNSLNFITEEIINPSYNMPRAILIAVPVIILCYILANVAFFAVLYQDEMADFTNNQAVPGFVTVFGAKSLGKAGQILFPLLIACSAFGSLDGGAFVGSRVVYASAQRGDFPKIFARLYGHTAPVPVRALIFEGLIAVIMLTGSNFQELVSYFAVASWVFYFLAASVVVVLRFKEPNLERPFKVWLPIPILFCAIALMLVVATVIQQPKAAAISLGCVAIGIPVYFIEGPIHDYIVKRWCPGGLASISLPRPHIMHRKLNTNASSHDDTHGDMDDDVNQLILQNEDEDRIL